MTLEPEPTKVHCIHYPISLTMRNKSDDKPKQNAFWPTIDSIQTARETAMQGFWAAVFVAVLTAIAALVSIVVGNIAGLPISAWSFIDAGIFVAIAIGIRRMSRIAAALGLVLYIGGRIYMWSLTGPPTAGIVMFLFITLAFVHGVRGTLAYHRYRRQGIEETLGEVEQEPVDDFRV
jgi:hypothetical protein